MARAAKKSQASKAPASNGKLVPNDDLKSPEPLYWSNARGTEVWAMFTAAIAGDVAQLRALLNENPKLVECEYEYRKPLYFAVRENQLEAVQLLIERGANPVKTWGGLWHERLTDLCRTRGYAEIERLLEDYQSEKHHISPEGGRIAALIRDRKVEQAKKLLDKQPELLHAADGHGNQPIHWAAMTRQLGLIDDLLQRGADINARRPDGARPVELTNGDYHYRGWRDLPKTAIRTPDLVLGYLLARGAEYDLLTAARVGDVERVTELLDANPELVNQVPPYSTYYSGLPLWLAAKGGYYELVKLLLERGANPNEPEPVAPEGHALYAAVSNKHIQIVRLLLEHGANPNAAVESSGDVMWMARNAGKEMVDLLASYGGGFSMELATYDGDIGLIGTMLRANPSLPLKSSWIQNAVSQGHEAVLRRFLSHNPDVLKPLTLGDTQDVKMARLLLDNGLNPNTTNWLGVGPLHRLAREGNTEIAELCLECGADINARDLDNLATPLGWATRFGKRTMVKFLLERGAQINLPDEEPWASPQAIAEREGHLEISEVLGSWGQGPGVDAATAGRLSATR